MATNWKGYYIKTVKTGLIFPMKYIKEKSYSATPNQREELEAYRDDNTRNLTRVTADGMKSTFLFNTRPLWLEDVIEIQKFFTDAEVDAKQRKIQLVYWNDETYSYKTGYFYRPNMDFKQLYATEKSIKYDSLELKFVEY
jgi:hypothetical protein